MKGLAKTKMLGAFVFNNPAPVKKTRLGEKNKNTSKPEYSIFNAD
jgi:hypothetical protein